MIKADITIQKQTAASQNIGLSGSQLSFILGVGDLLNTRKGYQAALDKVLSVSFEGTPISKGCIYFKNGNDEMHFKASLGFPQDENAILRNFCLHPTFLRQVIAQRSIVQIPLPKPMDAFLDEILEKLNITSGVFIPILIKEQEGVLFLVDNSNKSIFFPDTINRYQELANQIGQMISFIKRYQIVSASEKRYRSLMENASCSMFIADVDGVLLETNKEGEKLTGNTKSELIGKKFREFLTPPFRQQLPHWMAELQNKHYITLTAIQIQRADGSIRTVEGSVVLVDVGKEILFLMIGTDVTEINFLRGKALLNDKLATIGLLAAGVAHEINNPISWIISNFDVLKDQLVELDGLTNKLATILSQYKEDERKSEMQELLSFINRNNRFKMLDELLAESMQGAKRIQGIVQDLRNYSRPEKRGLEKIDLHKVLDSAINMALPELKHRAQLIKNYASNLPMISLNEGKIHQVVLNLLVNAAHSIEERDAQANSITITTFIESNRVGISIADTGKGIDSDHLSKIFDPFFTTKPVGTGTGLGLFICHEIVRNLNGEITVQSKLGEGTVFTIYLPISSDISQANMLN